MKTYQHLLLAVDINENNDALVKEAIALAKQEKALLSVVHVVPQVGALAPYAHAYEFHTSLVKHAKDALHTLQEKYGLDAKHIHLVEGAPKHEITNFAGKIGADLIVCGSYGKHGLGLMLGSNANGILHFADTDVLTLRIDQTGKRLAHFPYQNIVVATSAHEDNLDTLKRASEVAHSFNATLHLIHVVADIAALGCYSAVQFDLRDAAEKEFLKFIDKQHLEVKPENIHVRMGLPKQEILHLAASVHAELVVLGSHGRRGLPSTILGSTANSVLHGAASDVLVIRLH